MNTYLVRHDLYGCYETIITKQVLSIGMVIGIDGDQYTVIDEL